MRRRRAMEKIKDTDFHLCYLETIYEDHLILWFANCEATECWGDDWDDVPFEFNAGEPYLVKGNFYKTIAIPREYVTNLITDETLNTDYSVQGLNQNRVLLFSVGNVDIHANDSLQKLNAALEGYVAETD